MKITINLHHKSEFKLEQKDCMGACDLHLGQIWIKVKSAQLNSEKKGPVLDGI